MSIHGRSSDGLRRDEQRNKQESGEDALMYEYQMCSLYFAVSRIALRNCGS
jgi:hypothetical protein